MDQHGQLELLHQLSQTLLAPQPLRQRLAQVLEQVRRSCACEAIRLIVLSDPEPWSMTLPSQSDPSARWPKTFTADLIQQRVPIERSIDGQRQYLGLPICWQQTHYGAIEAIVPPQMRDTTAALLQALAPLFATALSNIEPPADQSLELAPLDQQQLNALTQQLQSPMLLQPLLANLLRYAIDYAGAQGGAIHLAETNGHGLHLLAFELPRDTAARSNGSQALVPSSYTLDLAKVALANSRAMIRQQATTTQFAAPIVHEQHVLGAITLEGTQFDSATLLFVQRLAEIAGPAVLRARFYQELADARTHLQQVFDELPTGLALTDSNGTLLRSNPAWWQLWGIDQAQADQIKLVPWDILPRIVQRLADPLSFADVFNQALASGRETPVVLQHPFKELRLLFVQVRDTLNVPTGFLLAVNDVTREREAERVKSEFVSVVSHELKTPLTSILGYTELLLAREFEPAERREFIQTVHKEADHLSNLVEDLLSVSRLDAGKIKLERWVIALPKLIRELVAQLNAELDIERHRLLLDVPDDLPPIHADRDRVRQILSNLLSNAIKYSPEGGEVVLQAAVLRDPPASAPALPPDPALLISVRDQGIGIPAHELPRVFDRFYRVDNSNTRRIGGTGLGLAITRALVELHGGRIWAESAPGEGSTFYLTLPLATEMLRTRM